MKVIEHVEHLLRQGQKPKEPVELGFPRPVVSRVRRQLAEGKPGGAGSRSNEFALWPTGDGSVR